MKKVFLTMLILVSTSVFSQDTIKTKKEVKIEKKEAKKEKKELKKERKETKKERRVEKHDNRH